MSLIAKKLAPARRAYVASPAFVARQGAPNTPEDLARLPCLSYGHTTSLQRWRIVVEGEAIAAPINSVLCSNNGDVLRAAALAGLGVAELPTFLIGADIEAGQLQTVLAACHQSDVGPQEMDMAPSWMLSSYSAHTLEGYVEDVVA